MLKKGDIVIVKSVPQIINEFKNSSLFEIRTNGYDDKNFFSIYYKRQEGLNISFTGYRRAPFIGKEAVVTEILGYKKDGDNFVKVRLKFFEEIINPRFSWYSWMLEKRIEQLEFEF